MGFRGDCASAIGFKPYSAHWLVQVAVQRTVSYRRSKRVNAFSDVNN